MGRLGHYRPHDLSPPLPAIRDNGAMQTEPPKRKRLRLQFRLRTLMIVVTLLAIYCGTVAWFLDDRQRLIRERDQANQRQAEELFEQLRLSEALWKIRHDEFVSKGR